MFQPPPLVPRPSLVPPLAPVPLPGPSPLPPLASLSVPPRASHMAMPIAMPVPVPMAMPVPNAVPVSAPVPVKMPLPTLAEADHTLFVSGIAPGVTDANLMRILGTCGKVLIWKRPLDNSGKPCSFGFCVYESPAALLKALRVIEGEEEAFIGGIELEGENGGLKRLRLSISPEARQSAMEYVERQRERAAEEKNKGQSTTAVAVKTSKGEEMDAQMDSTEDATLKIKEEIKEEEDEDEEMEEGEERVASPEDHKAYAEIQGILEALKAEKADAFLSSLAPPEPAPVSTPTDGTPKEAPAKPIPKDISDIQLDPDAEEDPLSDLPPEITPEQKIIIRKEIKLFRENTAEKDKERREREQAVVLESRRRAERELDREKERKIRDEARKNLNNKKKGVSPTEVKKPTSRLMLSKEDEEEERLDKEKRDMEQQRLFITQEQKWLSYEASRSKRLAEEERHVKEYETRRLDSMEKSLAWLKAFDDDKEMGTDEFFTHHERWVSRRHRDRVREEEEDAKDIALEAKEKEEAAQQKAAPVEAPQVVGRIMTKEERTLAMKELVNKIPADREGLFSWPVQWSFVTRSLIESKLKPFVAKKVVEYLGEEMADVVDHVVNAVAKRTSAEGVFNEMEAALGEDADVFVMKLWRILVYETEARAQGIL